MQAQYCTRLRQIYYREISPKMWIALNASWCGSRGGQASGWVHRLMGGGAGDRCGDPGQGARPEEVSAGERCDERARRKARSSPHPSPGDKLGSRRQGTGIVGEEGDRGDSKGNSLGTARWLCGREGGR